MLYLYHWIYTPIFLNREAVSIIHLVHIYVKFAFVNFEDNFPCKGVCHALQHPFPSKGLDFSRLSQRLTLTYLVLYLFCTGPVAKAAAIISW